jgi:hypothetical protein
MDSLSVISAKGGSDLYVAGTYKYAKTSIATLTLTTVGSSGTATITANGLAKVATYATSPTVTAKNFCAANAVAYAALGIVLTTTGATLIFTVTGPGKTITVSIANLTTDLTGTVVYTQTHGTNVATFTPAGSTAGGTVLIIVNGVASVLTFDTSWDVSINTASAGHFLYDSAATYLAQGITVTGSSTTIVFTANADTTIYEARAVTLLTNTATIVLTSTRLPYPIAAVGVHEEAVITSMKYLDKSGNVISKFRSFPGITLNVGAPVLIFEDPLAEIVFTGELVLYFVK